MNKKKLLLTFLTSLLLTLLLSMSVCAAGSFKVVNNNTYYYNEDGSRQKGWLTLGAKKYYFSPKTGIMYTGIRKIAGNTVEFGVDGVYVRTYQKAGFKTTASGKIYYYFGSGRTRPKKCWMTLYGKTYYFDKKGFAKVGWKKVNGYTYYFSKKGVMQANKWKKYNGHTFYLSSDGRIAKDIWIGTRYVDSNGYYIKGYIDARQTTTNKTGWAGYGTTWKYYKKNKLVTGWKTINKKRYYFNTNGIMRIGWFTDKDGSRYFLDTRSKEVSKQKPDLLGQALTGWVKISNNYYYFFSTKIKSNGVTYAKYSMARNANLRFKLTNGTYKVYRFDSNGVCTNR